MQGGRGCRGVKGGAGLKVVQKGNTMYAERVLEDMTRMEFGDWQKRQAVIQGDWWKCNIKGKNRN